MIRYLQLARCAFVAASLSGTRHLTKFLLMMSVVVVRARVRVMSALVAGTVTTRITAAMRIGVVPSAVVRARRMRMRSVGTVTERKSRRAQQAGKDNEIRDVLAHRRLPVELRGEMILQHARESTETCR
jgi:hypothetical protein